MSPTTFHPKPKQVRRKEKPKVRIAQFCVKKMIICSKIQSNFRLAEGVGEGVPPGYALGCPLESDCA